MQALTAGLDKTNSAESLILYAKAKRSQVGGTGNGMRNINNGADIITKVYPADIIPDKKILEQEFGATLGEVMECFRAPSIWDTLTGDSRKNANCVDNKSMNLTSEDVTAVKTLFKIAKVAITNVLLWFCIWTPYSVVSALPVFGLKSALTPLVAAMPAFLGKQNSNINVGLYRDDGS